MPTRDPIAVHVYQRVCSCATRTREFQDWWLSSSPWVLISFLLRLVFIRRKKLTVFFLSDTASTYSTLRIPRQYPAGPASPARSAQSPHVRTPRAGHPLGYGVMRRAWSTALRRRPATAAVLAQVLGAPRVTKVASLPLGPPGEPPSPSPRPSSSSSSSSESISPSASASSSPACPQRWA